MSVSAHISRAPAVLAFDVFPCAGVDRVLLASAHGQMHCLLLPPLGASPALGYAIDDDVCKPQTCDIQVCDGGVAADGQMGNGIVKQKYLS